MKNAVENTKSRSRLTICERLERGIGTFFETAPEYIPPSDEEIINKRKSTVLKRIRERIGVAFVEFLDRSTDSPK